MLNFSNKITKGVKDGAKLIATLAAVGIVGVAAYDLMNNFLAKDGQTFQIKTIGNDKDGNTLELDDNAEGGCVMVEDSRLEIDGCSFRNCSSPTVSVYAGSTGQARSSRPFTTFSPPPS